MKQLVRIGIGVSCFALLAGCAQSPQAIPGSDTATGEQQAEAIEIGIIAPLSGPASSYGEDAIHVYRQLQSQINQAGGIDGAELKLIIEDGKCNGKEATAAAQKLVNVDKVQVIVGGSCSSETIPAGKIAQQNEVVLISPTASSPEVSQIGEYVWRYWNDVDAGAVMVDFLEQEAESIALIYENTDYAAAYANVIRETFAGEIVIDEKFATEEKDFSILAKNVVDSADEVDYIVYIPQSEATMISFVKALQGEGAWDERKDKFIGSETVVAEAVSSELGATADGIKGVQFPPLTAFGPQAQEAMSALTDGYEVKGNATFIIFDADALDLAVDAISEVGNDAEAVLGYLQAITAETPRDGYVGEIYFDEQGDGQGIEFQVVRIEDGELITVE